MCMIPVSGSRGRRRSGVLALKCLTMALYPRLPRALVGVTASRARRSASMMGSENGGEERIAEDVDFPVEMEPVRPMRSMGARGK